MPEPATSPSVPRSGGFDRVTHVLASRGHPHRPRWLESPAHTAQAAAAALGVEIGQIAKSVVFRRLSDNGAVLVVASGDRRVDESRVAALVGELGRADAAFVKRQTGFSIGGVAPLGHTGEVTTLIDADLFRFDAIWAAAGHPQGVFEASPSQLRNLTGAPVVALTVTDGGFLGRPLRVPSPCTGVCRIDEASGWCIGCARSLAEIAAWSTTPDAARDEVRKHLPARLAALHADGRGDGALQSKTFDGKA